MTPHTPGWPLMSEEYWSKVRNFSQAEKWGDPYRVHAQLVFALQELRDAVGKPIHIHCAFAITGHSKGSYHYKGMAADLHIEGLHLVDQFLAAERIGMFGGIGIYPHWNNPGLHLDIGEKGRRWARNEEGLYVPMSWSLLKTLK